MVFPSAAKADGPTSAADATDTAMASVRARRAPTPNSRTGWLSGAGSGALTSSPARRFDVTRGITVLLVRCRYQNLIPPCPCQRTGPLCSDLLVGFLILLGNTVAAGVCAAPSGVLRTGYGSPRGPAARPGADAPGPHSLSSPLGDAAAGPERRAVSIRGSGTSGDPYPVRRTTDGIASAPAATLLPSRSPHTSAHGRIALAVDVSRAPSRRGADGPRRVRRACGRFGPGQGRTGGRLPPRANAPHCELRRPHTSP